MNLKKCFILSLSGKTPVQELQDMHDMDDQVMSVP